VIDPRNRAPAKSLEPVAPKKDYGPPEVRERNANGDFIVTKIVIPDLKVPVVEDDKNSDEESSEESEEEVREAVEEIEEEKVVVK